VTGCRLSGRQPFSRLAPAQNFVAESHQTAMNSIAIIIRWNGLPEPLLQRCLSSILWQLSPADAVFLVGGGSPNETPIPLLAHVTVVRTAAAISLFTASLLCKPSTAFLPILCFIAERFYHQNQLPSWIVNNDAPPLRTNRMLKSERFLNPALHLAPFALAALGAAIVTILAEQHVGAIPSSAEVPASVALANALSQPWNYVQKFLIPANLLIFYPFREQYSLAKVVFALVGIGLLAHLLRTPNLKAFGMVLGLAWFLFGLLPVAGLIPVGHHSMANRYAYLPLMGFALFVVSFVANIRIPLRRSTAVACAICFFALEIATTRCHLRHWSSSYQLYSYCVESDPDCWIAQNVTTQVQTTRKRCPG
jgi:protein O-mannosyl-transferase